MYKKLVKLILSLQLLLNNNYYWTIITYYYLAIENKNIIKKFTYQLFLLTIFLSYNLNN